MNYTKEYFIQKFEAIPEEKWTTGKYTDGYACCVIGHCGVSDYAGFERSDEAQALYKLIFSLTKTKYLPTNPLVSINDGKQEEYKQDTPKQRILAALKDLT